MAVYQVPQQLKDIWDTSKQSLIDILASATMQPYPEDRLSMFTPAQALGNMASQAQQGIPQGLADMIMQGSPEQAMSEGISGLVGPMTTYNFKKAKNLVDGRIIRDDVPNISLIESTFNKGEYKIMPGIRDVKMDYFETNPVNLFYDKRDLDRVKTLAEEISKSNEINPLIVAVDKDGPYI